MLYLHQESLSPDPTYGQAVTKLPGNKVGQTLYPHELMHVRPASEATRRWSRQLNIFQKPPALPLRPAADGTTSLTVDFGAEVDAFLELEVTTPGPSALLVWFGESLPEAEGFIASQHPDPRSDRYLAKAGRHRLRFDQRGFRFVRLIFNDVRQAVVIHRLAADARFTFQRRDGDFQCSDRRFQRVWQTSTYTARVCTQSDTIWDGIKRDRGGWFGDARVIKLAVDHVFFDPRPAEAMMATLPSDTWGNRIPNYSFDAAAMLKQHILFYGSRIAGSWTVPTAISQAALIRRLLSRINLARVRSFHRLANNSTALVTTASGWPTTVNFTSTLGIWDLPATTCLHCQYQC